MPARIGYLRVWAMIASSSGCNSGSPPLKVTMVVPRRARSSMRRFIVSSAMGLEKSSNSLQYVHERLQRRMGIMGAITGWSVETNPLAIIFNSRSRRLQATTRRRTPGNDFGILKLAIYYNIPADTVGKHSSLCGEFPPVNGVG